ncbi:MAG: CsbD family protein [Nocardia sp.]|nr:CsbD family protein [Nocardia sp.]
MTEHEKSTVREGLEGLTESVKGKVKEVAGAAAGDEALRREGRAQQDRSQAQREAAAKEAEAERERGKAAADEERQRAHQSGRD